MTARATRRLNRLIRENATDNRRDHGTLMTGSMVLATLADRKRATRRVLTDRNSEGNFKPEELDLATSWVDPGLGGGAYLKAYLKPEVSERLGEPPRDSVHRLYCRIQIGDRLWIRESFAGPDHIGDGDQGVVGFGIEYKADGEFRAHGDCGCDGACSGVLIAHPWKPSIHMPRWASRITLEVTGVRPERVQEISDEDAIAEGVFKSDGLWHYEEPSDRTIRPGGWQHASGAFAGLWDVLNEPRGFGWDVNPLVWVISFKRVS